MAKKPKHVADAASVFQFKITLCGVEPPIWRRIQVSDGSLDDLHGYIQAAMGWENCHLHEFEIGGDRYGDPEMLDDGYGDEAIIDSLDTRLGELFAKRRKGFRFRYQYDFGDSWDHEIMYEGRAPADPKVKYPVCVDGARAGPPEDCGGCWGYANLLEALSDPDHAEHEDMSEWAGDIKPEKFTAAEMSRRMQPTAVRRVHG